MKKLGLILSVMLIGLTAFGQAPQQMSYQAILRDATDAILSNQSVGVQISILQGSISGTSVYVETQAPVTNINGLISLEIGTGTIVSGQFNTIDWSNGPYFIKSETDPTGGTSYTISGTSQLMSVPYAFHADVADSIAGGISITESDPVFQSSLAFYITAADTTYWGIQTVDTDTQLDSIGVAALGFVAGAHTIDTDTQLDALGVTALGFVAGPHTVDTQLDSTGIATLGYVAGPHTIDTDTQLDALGITALGFEAGPHAVDTQIDSTGIAALGYVAGPHTGGLFFMGTARAKNMGSPNPNVDNEIPTGTTTTIRWQNINDNYGSAIGGTNNTTITIPAEVQWIKINSSIIYDQNLTTTDIKSTFFVNKNGSPFTDLTNSGYMTYQVFNALYGLHYSSELIPVTPGDVFDIGLFHNAGSSLYLSWGSISSAVSFEFYKQ
ncbi:MAG: hypothetical protein ACJA1C_001239 [Crocinitomicaceae bacterium]|jgi:hypothetical protein